MPYCFPPYWPALTMNGFRCLKFEISDGSHGCTSPLVAKYFVQPTYGRNRSAFVPAWIFASASDSFVMYVNCGFDAVCVFTYDANIDWPPSLPYPAQSNTCRRPVSAIEIERIASAMPVRPARTPAPPVAAAYLNNVWRSNRLLSSPSIPVRSPFLVARGTDHEHHLGGLVARIRDAVW